MIKISIYNKIMVFQGGVTDQDRADRDQAADADQDRAADADRDHAATDLAQTDQDLQQAYRGAIPVSYVAN